MTLTTRLLPPQEWHRLKGTELEAVYPHLDHTKADVIVVEDDGEIVGCWALMTVVHAEGLWVSPEARGRASVQRKLLLAFYKRCMQKGLRAVATSAVSEDVEGLLRHIDAQPVPGTLYMMQIEERQPCQQ